MTKPTTEQIQRAVSEALEEAKAQVGSERLLPFTSAEIGFIQEVVAGALTRVLLENIGS